MKKLFVIGICIVLALNAAGCNDSGKNEEPGAELGTLAGSGQEDSAKKKAPEGTASENGEDKGEEDGTESVVEVSLKAPEMRMIEVGPIGTGTNDFSFEMPENWNYEITESTSSPDAYIAAKIRPNSETEGEIVIQWTDSFGVCGTGLETSLITINGHEARCGVYDQHEHWDYIAFTGDYSGCVILNNCPDSWWGEYEDDINAIVNSFTYGKCTHGDGVHGEHHGEHEKDNHHGENKIPIGL